MRKSRIPTSKQRDGGRARWQVGHDLLLGHKTCGSQGYCFMHLPAPVCVSVHEAREKLHNWRSNVNAVQGFGDVVFFVAIS